MTNNHRTNSLLETLIAQEKQKFSNKPQWIIVGLLVIQCGLLAVLAF